MSIDLQVFSHKSNQFREFSNSHWYILLKTKMCKINSIYRQVTTYIIYTLNINSVHSMDGEIYFVLRWRTDTSLKPTSNWPQWHYWQSESFYSTVFMVRTVLLSLNRLFDPLRVLTSVSTQGGIIPLEVSSEDNDGTHYVWSQVWKMDEMSHCCC